VLHCRERFMRYWVLHSIVGCFTFVEEGIFMVDLHDLYQLVNCLGCLGFEVFAVFHGSELLVHFEDKGDEPILVGFLVFVELEDSLLQDEEEGVDTLVVDFLLGSSRKARVDGHSYDMKLKR